MNLLQKVAFYFELKSYGVCTWWGQKLGIKPSRVKVSFIYATVFGLGSPLLLYFFMAWVLEHKHYFQFIHKPRKTIWEL